MLTIINIMGVSGDSPIELLKRVEEKLKEQLSRNVFYDLEETHIEVNFITTIPIAPEKVTVIVHGLTGLSDKDTESVFKDVIIPELHDAFPALKLIVAKAVPGDPRDFNNLFRFS